MYLRVSIVRSQREMYGDIDQKFAEKGVVCETLDPQALISMSWFENGPFPDLLFVPLSCMDVTPDGSWLDAFQEAAREKGTHVAWVMGASEKSNLGKHVETALTVSELDAYIRAVTAQFSSEGRKKEGSTSGSLSHSGVSKMTTSGPTRIAKTDDNGFIQFKVDEKTGFVEGLDDWLSGKAPEAAEPRPEFVELDLDFNADTERSGNTPPPPSRPTPSDATRMVSRQMPPIPEPRGGSARDAIRSTTDIGVLKDYIQLKEDEIRDLRNHIQVFETENTKLFREMEYIKNEKEILDRKVDTLRGRLLFLEQENEKLRKAKKHDLEVLRAEYKNKMEKLQISEERIKEQELKFEDLRNRVRNDLFSIQERERYLEARMEILKRDTEILLHQKDERILELQENTRQMEFKNDAYQENLNRYKEEDREEQDRSQRIIRALKLATSLLDNESDDENDGDIRKRQG